MSNLIEPGRYSTIQLQLAGNTSQVGFLQREEWLLRLRMIFLLWVLFCLNAEASVTFSNPRVERLNELLEEARQESDTGTMAAGLLELAGMYASKGDLDQAAEYYNDAIPYFQALGNQRGLAQCCLGSGTVYVQKGDYKKALRWFEKSEQVCRQSGDSSLLAFVYKEQGSLFMQMGRGQKAHQAFLKSEELARKYQLADVLKSSLEGLSSAENREGDFLSSLVHYRESEAIKDSIERNVAEENIHTAQQGAASIGQGNLANIEKEYQAQKYKMARHRLAFCALGAGLILVIALAIISFQLYRLRTRKETLRLTLRNLRQQMNPHFLFNVMNSVYLHVLEGNREESLSYLSQLTRLLRKMLDNSRLDMVSLADEMELIRCYLELESKRLKTFTYNISADQSLPAGELLIPSMLLQPYVENAVVHGVSSIENGRIEIAISKDADTIHCEISDNGIGRKRSEELRRIQQQSHQSAGTNITATRFKLLNQLYKKPVNARIIDKYDPSGLPGGTRVLIDLPFEPVIDENILKTQPS